VRLGPIPSGSKRENVEILCGDMCGLDRQGRRSRERGRGRVAMAAVAIDRSLVFGSEFLEWIWIRRVPSLRTRGSIEDPHRDVGERPPPRLTGCSLRGNRRRTGRRLPRSRRQSGLTEPFDDRELIDQATGEAEDVPQAPSWLRSWQVPKAWPDRSARVEPWWHDSQRSSVRAFGDA
jgi:hypothetical protein